MREENYRSLVDDQTWQVFIMSTPISIPLTMFVHAYIVTNERGTLTRWDVVHRPSLIPDSVDHVHRNIAAPWRGLGYLYSGKVFATRYAFTPQCLGMITHETHGVLARQMIDFLHRRAFAYPYASVYRYFGPNSNTFVQWFLLHFDTHHITLPSRALGKNFAIKQWKNEL